MLQLPALPGMETMSGGAAVYADDERSELFYVLPQTARIASGAGGVPLLNFVKYRSRPPGSDDATGGGFLELQTELTLGPQHTAAITEELQRRVGRPVVLTHPTFVDGRVQLLTMSPKPGAMVEAIVGSAKPSLQPGLRASFSLKLSRDGAALLWDTMRATPSPVAVSYELDLLARFPPATVHASVRGGVAAVDVVDWPADQAMAPLRAEIVGWAQDLLVGTGDQDIVFTGRSAVVWTVRPGSTIAGLEGQTRGFVEADLTDPIFAILRVTVRVNADLSAGTIKAVTVRLAYGTHKHDAVFTDAAATDLFEAVVDPALGRRYRYQAEVHFAASSKTLLLPEVESDAANLLVSLDDVGWLRRDVSADNVDWTVVAAVQVALRYADPAAGVPEQTDVVALDRGTPSRPYERAVFAVIAQPVQHRITYVLVSGRRVEKDWAPSPSRLLVVPDVFDRSIVVRFTAPAGFDRVASHAVEAKHTGKEGRVTPWMTALTSAAPVGIWTQGLLAGDAEDFTYRVTSSGLDGASSAGDWVSASGSGSIPVGELPGIQLTVEASAYLVDLSAVKVLAVTFTAIGAQPGHLVFGAGRPITAQWQTYLGQGVAALYSWTAAYHLCDGTRRTASGGPSSDPTVVLPPAPS